MKLDSRMHKRADITEIRDRLRTRDAA